MHPPITHTATHQLSAKPKRKPKRPIAKIPLTRSTFFLIVYLAAILLPSATIAVLFVCLPHSVCARGRSHVCVSVCSICSSVCKCFLPFSLCRSSVLSVFAHVRILCRILDRFPFIASATIRFSHLEQSVNDHYFYQFICMLCRAYILRLPVCSLLSVCRWCFSFGSLTVCRLLCHFLRLVQYQYEHADTQKRCCSFLLGRLHSIHHTKNCDLCKQTEKHEEKDEREKE